MMQFQTVSKEKNIVEPKADITITGTVSGKVVASIITAWRSQKTILEAGKRLIIRKEAIGSDTGEIPEDYEIADMKETDPRLRNASILKAPLIIIGSKSDTSFLSKHIRFHTEHIYMLNTSVQGEIEVVLGAKLYQLLRKYQPEKNSLLKKLKNLTFAIEADLEDMKIKVARPGNENMQEMHKKLLLLLERDPDHKNAILTYVKKIYVGLQVRRFNDIIQRWQDKFAIEDKITKVSNKLKHLEKRLNGITIDLTIEKFIGNAKIIIKYEDQEHVISKTTANSVIHIEHKLELNPETGLQNGKLIFRTR